MKTKQEEEMYALLDKHCKENDITFISAYWMSKGMTLPEGQDDANKLKRAIISAMEEHGKTQALGFAKWHDKTDALRENPTRWTELYDNYKNGHLY